LRRWLPLSRLRWRLAWTQSGPTASGGTTDAQRTRILDDNPGGERRYVTRTRYTEKPREEWIAVPVPDAGVPKEDVERARDAIRNNEKCSSAGRRFWELSGGIFRCAQCGRALVAVTTLKGPKRRRRRMFYYICATPPKGQTRLLVLKVHERPEG
jgi:hypothetical protein